MTERNELGQPVGDLLPGWSARPRPAPQVLAGRRCRLEPLDPARHASELHDANRADRTGQMWTYLPYGPFSDLAGYRNWAEQVAAGDQALFYAIVAGQSATAAGVLALQRIEEAMGSIEIAHVAFSPGLQSTTPATEAIFLVLAYVFDDLGYRRCEWKCDALNAASRRAADRFGFTYEGTFRQAVVVKGRNRDTAWFSIIDSEWPQRRRAFGQWLSPENFGPDGRQIRSLQEIQRAQCLSDGPPLP